MALQSGLLSPSFTALTFVNFCTPAAASMADRSSSPHEKQQTEHHVDVQQAEAAFQALARQLSSQSQSIGSTAAGQDLEKADEDARFDLREYLSSSNDANQRAGIKHKVFFSPSCSSKSLICVSMSVSSGKTFKSRLWEV